VKHKKGKFKSGYGGQIYYQCWIPHGKIYAVLLLVHGIAEHSGRYKHVAEYFVSRGYAVYSYDHPGHGKSDGKRVYVNRFEEFTFVLKNYTEMIQSWQPGKKMFLMGHSMGGLICTDFLLKDQNLFSGAVLTGSAVKVPEFLSPFTIFMGKVLSFMIPAAGLLGLDPEGICSDPCVVNSYLEDPLVYKGKTTARLASEMLHAIRRVESCAVNIKIPILIMHGASDVIVDPAASQALYDAVSSSDRELIFFDGFLHEILNEPGKDRVLGKAETWINRHCQRHEKE